MSHNVKSIDEWGRLVYSNSQNPGLLAEINVQIAGYYAYLTGEYIKTKFLYSEFYKKKKFGDEKVSDKAIEMLWLLESDGVKWYTLKKELRAYEQLMSAVKTATIVANQEQKNI